MVTEQTDLSFILPNLFGKDREVHVRIEPMRSVGAYAREGRRLVAERRKLGRAYLWGEPDPEETADLKTPAYGQRGENADNDKGWDLYNAEEKRIMRVVLDKVFAEIDSRLGLKAEKMSFSRTAGCSCGCSPGFMLKGLRAEVRINVREVGGKWWGFNGSFDAKTPYDKPESNEKAA